MSTNTSLQRRRNLVDDDAVADDRHGISKEERETPAGQPQELTPSSSPSPIPICKTNPEGNFGETEGMIVSEQELRYNYEIETKLPTKGEFLIEKVEEAISSRILAHFIETCAFSLQIRRLDGGDTTLARFSSKPDDTLNANGCRVSPSDGIGCASVNGQFSLFVLDEMDLQNAKLEAIESLESAMVEDEFLHIDTSIVKITFVPYTEGKPPAQTRDVSANQNASSSGFNRNYLAFVPFGVICFVFLLFVVRRNKNAQRFNPLSESDFDEHDLCDSQINWKDAKVERLSSAADSVRSEFAHYVDPGETSSERSSIDDPEISFHDTRSSNGFEIRLVAPY